jgi:prepilin-type N-terminal cleavage/methylation domain-containing protein
MDDLYNRVARRRRSGQRGFTLIELLVVIAVLAVLAAIVIFNVTGVVNRGTSAACLTDLETVQTASDAYYSDDLQAGRTVGTYPPNLAALVPAYIHTAPTDLGTVTWDTSTGTVTSSAC